MMLIQFYFRQISQGSKANGLDSEPGKGEISAVSERTNESTPDFKAIDTVAAGGGKVRERAPLR